MRFWHLATVLCTLLIFASGAIVFNSNHDPAAFGWAASGIFIIGMVIIVGESR